MTVAFFWRLRISRVVGAMSPSERMPVATWYSSGWNKWWEVRARIVMSASARFRRRAAVSPAKPDPMMTTLWRDIAHSPLLGHPKFY